MIHLPAGRVRFYEDGPWWPKTPTQQAAEAAYREAFLKAAREAATWIKVDEVAINQAWEERRAARQRAEELVPSGVLYGPGPWRGKQVIYRVGHEVEASRTRGRVHGFEFVRQCHDELIKAGVAAAEIGPTINAPWLEQVAAWVTGEIDPERILLPPRPAEDLSGRQRSMLQQAKRAIATSQSAEPQAILRKLEDITREELEWLWPGRIPLGKVTLLAGDPGLGKSFVTLDLAARVSRGQAWPDMPLLKQTPGGVILLNCEDDASDTIAPRLDRAGADETRVVLLEGVTFLGKRRQFSLESDIPRLAEALGQFAGTRLVVIDPIAAYCGKVDSHKNSDVRGMLAPLAELASVHRVAILTVTHLSKSGGSKAVYRAMGSLAFAAAARAVWAVTKDPTNPERRLLLPAKLNLARDPDGLAYRIIDGRVAWEYEPVRMHADDAFAAEEESHHQTAQRGLERREAAAWLGERLAAGPAPSIQVLADAKEHGISERTLRRAFKEMGCRSRKGSDGQWHWGLDPQRGLQDDHVPP
jgi:hypothetical protein